MTVFDASDKHKNEEIVFDDVPIVKRGLREQLYRAPYWFFVLVSLWLYVGVSILLDEKYNIIANYLKDGIGLTIYLSLVSYAIALTIGLITGIIRSNPPHAPERGVNLMTKISRIVHTVVYNLVTLYVEFMRGIPAIVFLLIAGFIIAPELRNFINTTIVPLLRDLLNQPDIPNVVWRANDPGTAIAGLSLIYGAYLSEIFRAGILSVAKGQVEAARSLGMSYFQVMRYIVVPQAIRSVLPPIGNDFIAMIKDTSLVTVLGVNEITQLSRKWSGSSFQYLETYLVLSLIYLTMTVTGSILVQALERRLRRHERG